MNRGVCVCVKRLILLETKDVNEETVRGIYVEVKLK